METEGCIETWKEIKGYENLYQVSNLGRVRSLDRITVSGRGNGDRLIKGRILVGGVTNKYHFVLLTQLDGTKKNYYRHRLVAEAFIPNPDNKPCVDHIDGNPNNNALDNLRWVTASENQNNPITLERMSCALKKYLSSNNPSMKGKQHSEETKEKIRNKLKKFSDEELKEHRKAYVDKHREKHREYWRNSKRRSKENKAA